MNAEVQGLVLNDAHGLALKAEGDLKYTTQKQKSGFFSSIAEKAEVLRDLHADDEDADNDDGDAAAFPVVRLETSTRTLLVSRIAGEGRPERTLTVSKRRGLTDEE
jgi:hypothetical protein|uniref:Uncharacterized protein n=1 Tax=Globisporangium ultimum (strain ATCC 200006 / CBS 805.95 / DAOM BR144) TaxID=431595 RepID=K3X321_GLOUD